MNAPGTESAFDVAEWFLDTALNNREYLQPMKMQYLMFLAQGYFAAMTAGKRLMPCIFIATERGPVEPNTYKIYAQRRPDFTRAPMPKHVSELLDGIWRRFGAYSAGYLGKMLCGHLPVAEALSNGNNTEIRLKSMTEFYAKASTAGDDMSNRPRMLRSQSGKTVCVKRWEPGKKQSS